MRWMGGEIMDKMLSPYREKMMQKLVVHMIKASF